MPTLKVMTWNLEKLFLPDAGATDQVRERFAAKIANLAAVIDQQQPDLLALQEIDPDGALAALQESLGIPCPMRLRASRMAMESVRPSFRHFPSPTTHRSNCSRI